jgi:hypothetical protein
MTFFGPIIQICYLTDDLDSEIDYWLKVMGVGPFYTMGRRSFSSYSYRGEDRTSDSHIIERMALGYSGDLLIELIQPGPSPSAYTEFVSAGHKGPHHVGLASDDFENQRAKALEVGMEIVMEGSSPLARFAYVKDPRDRHGNYIELIDTSPAIMQAFATVKQASIGWDGADPIRPFG